MRMHFRKPYYLLNASKRGHLFIWHYDWNGDQEVVNSQQASTFMHKSYLLKTYSLVQVYFYLDHLRWSFDTEKDLSGMDLWRIFQNVNSLIPLANPKNVWHWLWRGYGRHQEKSFFFSRALPELGGWWVSNHARTLWPFFKQCICGIINRRSLFLLKCQCLELWCV